MAELDHSSESSVGLVIAVHNGARFVHETLDSLVAQEQPPDRVVVVDDCSSDDSVADVLSFADRLPLEIIDLLHNVGLSAARNHGIDRLDTDLLMFLDHDDVLLPGHIRHVAEEYTRSGGLISPAARLLFDDGTTRCHRRWLDDPFWRRLKLLASEVRSGRYARFDAHGTCRCSATCSISPIARCNGGTRNRTPKRRRSAALRPRARTASSSNTARTRRTTAPTGARHSPATGRLGMQRRRTT